MSTSSRNPDPAQQSLEQRAKALEREVEQLESVLDQHEEGWMEENEVLEYGRKANRAYDDLAQFEEGVLEPGVDYSEAEAAKSFYDEVTSTAAAEYDIDIPDPESRKK